MPARSAIAGYYTMVQKPCFAVALLLIAVAVLDARVASGQASSPGSGQAYPDRPIRLVTSAVGGSTDFAARLVASGLSSNLNQPIIVDNRGGGLVGIEIAARAVPDGYTLFYAGSILWLLPLLQENVSYNTLRDFAPVSLVVDSPNIILVHPSVAAKSVKELIALAKAKPGALHYGSGGAGSSGHLAAELFKAMAGVNIVRVPFKGTGPALTALLSGEIQVLMGSSGGTTPHIKGGKVRALAVTSAKRSDSYPELPTVAEAGVPGYEYGQTSGLFAPARTPVAIINRLSRETARAINRPEIKDKFAASGGDVEGSTPQEFSAKIKSEIVRLGKVIKDANIRAE